MDGMLSSDKWYIVAFVEPLLEVATLASSSYFAAVDGEEIPFVSGYVEPDRGGRLQCGTASKENNTRRFEFGGKS